MLIDSHCHLHDDRVIRDVETIVREAGVSGVRYMVTCATAEENFETTRQLAERFDAILPCFGLHPWFLLARSRDWKQNLAGYLESIPSGIGETGLDFTDRSWDFDDQKNVFAQHLALAFDMRRPINIHIRKAWDALIHMLKKTGPLPVPGMIHSYSGSAEMVKVLEKYNLYLSFSGAVTRPAARKAIQSLTAVRPDRFVLETDAPDIMPYIDGRQISGLNVPAMLPRIAAIAAKRIQVPEASFVASASENAAQLFKSVISGANDTE